MNDKTQDTTNNSAVSNNNEKEITNKDIFDMLTVLIERTGRIGDIEKKMDNGFRDIKLSLENDIKPTLQAVLENQTEVINQKAHISEVETKVDEAQDDISALKLAVQKHSKDIKEHSKDIEQLKKRA